MVEERTSDRGGDHRAELGARALDSVEFDDLLREVLNRVQGVLDEQARLRLLLDAVVTMGADLSLDGVLSRIVAIASTLVDAEYAALGVLDTGPQRRLRTFIHHGMDSDVVTEIGGAAHRPRAAGPAHRRAPADPAARHRRPPGVVRLPGAPSADELPRGAGPDPRQGLRQPLPDREGRWRGLHRGGRGDRDRSRGRGRRRYRERPSLRRSRTAPALVARDGGDHLALGRSQREPRRVAAGGRPGSRGLRRGRLVGRRRGRQREPGAASCLRRLLRRRGHARPVDAAFAGGAGAPHRGGGRRPRPRLRPASRGSVFEPRVAEPGPGGRGAARVGQRPRRCARPGLDARARGRLRCRGRGPAGALPMRSRSPVVWRRASTAARRCCARPRIAATSRRKSTAAASNARGPCS